MVQAPVIWHQSVNVKLILVENNVKIVSPITISGNIAFWDFCPPKIRKYNRPFAYSRLESKIKHFYTFFYRSYFPESGKMFLFHTKATERTKNMIIIFFKICRYLNLVRNCSIVLQHKENSQLVIT